MTIDGITFPFRRAIGHKKSPIFKLRQYQWSNCFPPLRKSSSAGRILISSGKFPAACGEQIQLSGEKK